MEKTPQYQTNLRELIEENGYTFKEISEETGISLSSLFIYARGERPIPHQCRADIARIIGCSVTSILSRKQSMQGVTKSIVTDDFLSSCKDDLVNRWNLYHTAGARYAYPELDVKLQELGWLAQIVKDTRWSV